VARRRQRAVEEQSVVGGTKSRRRMGRGLLRGQMVAESTQEGTEGHGGDKWPQRAQRAVEGTEGRRGDRGP
jgi:hypothetical protein